MKWALMPRVILQLTSCGVLLACNPNQPTEHMSDRCYVQVSDRQLFIGNEACMAALPRRHMKGIWVVGFEYSVFYENRALPVPIPTSEPPPSAQIWLDAKANVVRRYNIPDDEQTRQYLIDFIGVKSEVPGYYGHFGMYKKGAIVYKILSLREIMATGSHQKEEER